MLHPGSDTVIKSHTDHLADHLADHLGYAELQATSNFTFLTGGSHPQELVAQAKALGLSALAVTDRNTLAGVVRAHVAARELGLRLVIGSRLELAGDAAGGPSRPALPPPVAAPCRPLQVTGFICLPTDRAAYARLCRLLSLGQGRAAKGKCLIWREDLLQHAEGQILIALPPAGWHPRDPLAGTRLADDLAGLRQRLQGSLYLAACVRYDGCDRARLAALAEIATRAGVPLVATGDVLYHSPERRRLQDVLTCIRTGTTLARAGRALEANAERHLKPPSEMARLFADHPDAIARTLEIMAACRFSLDELVYEYPVEPVPAGKTAQAHLVDLTWAGASWRYPDGIPERVRATVERELVLIDSLGYAPYFLTVHDIVEHARALNILAQGRGSAANSAVCYCLGITAVDPTEIDLLFERFISSERREPPDIDVDFEHERREEIIQYIYARYGRDKAGLTATVISYRARSAVREVGKAMGLGADIVSALAGMVWGTRSGGALPEKHVREAGLDPDDPLLSTVLELADELIGFPRHLSQHVGGFVLTRHPLTEIVPVGNSAMEGRTIIEWDKDDISALGLLKIDVLALGMLTCIHRAFDMIADHHGRKLTLATVPREDPAVYDMLCKADSIGVFQVESRAQMNMLPRLRPRTFYDLVIEVAIVRPGPIQGDMVHPYLRRRSGLEAEEYPAPRHGDPDELRLILGKTKGVPLFQEQAMRIAMEAAKFSDAEVNELRKSMATFRHRGTIGRLEQKMISRMVERGYERDFAERCFNQIKGFGEYGFPESHAASFAHLVYVSSWLKHHYPAAFCGALLNSQPMGFYAPAQLVRDAREHGVEVRPVDVNSSAVEATLEPGISRDRPALRLGLTLIDGLGSEQAGRLVTARDGANRRPFTDIYDLCARSRCRRSTLEAVAAADACRSMGLDRRQALWQVSRIASLDALPLFQWSETREQGPEPDVALPDMALSEHVMTDYQTLRLSLKAHPVSFLRDRLAARRVLTCEGTRTLGDGARAAAAGIVLVRQRPGSANGVVFMTLEDETGVVNTVIWPKVLERYRKVVMTGRLIVASGRIQRHDGIIHLVAGRLDDVSPWLLDLTEWAADLRMPLAPADEVLRPPPSLPEGRGSAARAHHPRDERAIPRHLAGILPDSRDFH